MGAGDAGRFLPMGSHPARRVRAGTKARIHMGAISYTAAPVWAPLAEPGPDPAPCDNQRTGPILAVARCGRPLIRYCRDRTGRTVLPPCFPVMLRFCSVIFLIGAGCSSVVPVSLFLILAAAMAETLKQLNPDADRVA